MKWVELFDETVLSNFLTLVIVILSLHMSYLNKTLLFFLLISLSLIPVCYSTIGLKLLSSMRICPSFFSLRSVSMYFFTMVTYCFNLTLCRSYMQPENSTWQPGPTTILEKFWRNQTGNTAVPENQSSIEAAPEKSVREESVWPCDSPRDIILWFHYFVWLYFS